MNCLEFTSKLVKICTEIEVTKNIPMLGLITEIIHATECHLVFRKQPLGDEIIHSKTSKVCKDLESMDFASVEKRVLAPKDKYAYVSTMSTDGLNLLSATFTSLLWEDVKKVKNAAPINSVALDDDEDSMIPWSSPYDLYANFSNSPTIPTPEPVINYGKCAMYTDLNGAMNRIQIDFDVDRKPGGDLVGCTNTGMLQKITGWPEKEIEIWDHSGISFGIAKI